MELMQYNDRLGARVSKQMWESFDQLLLQQQLPSVFRRNIRSIIKHHRYFKASECLVFMLYTSRLTKHLFPANTPYFDHHMILVNSLYELLQPELTMQQLDKVQLELTHYVTQFQEVYGDRYVTLNVHLLTYLVDCVKRHGPLWCYTAFLLRALTE
ncbi:hypothetical protein D3C80_1513730 [compost metagenome]